MKLIVSVCFFELEQLLGHTSYIFAYQFVNRPWWLHWDIKVEASLAKPFPCLKTIEWSSIVFFFLIQAREAVILLILSFALPFWCYSNAFVHWIRMNFWPGQILFNPWFICRNNNALILNGNSLTLNLQPLIDFLLPIMLRAYKCYTKAVLLSQNTVIVES